MIDYSLLIFKVDWGSYKGVEDAETIRLGLSNHLMMVPSDIEDGVIIIFILRNN